MGAGRHDLRWRCPYPYLNQFIQPDSIVPNPYQPADWNRYSYTRDNPINFTDPSGYIAYNEGAYATHIVQDLRAYHVNIQVDWGLYEHGLLLSTYIPTNLLQQGSWGCATWEDGVWELTELLAIERGVWIIAKGIEYLGGDYNSLIGMVNIRREDSDDASSAGSHNITIRNTSQTQFEYRLHTVIHEMGHVITHNHPETMNYFLKELGASCGGNFSLRDGVPYCNENQQVGIYFPGRYAGGYSADYGAEYMPSEYATKGNWEDYADTFIQVILSAYLASGDTIYNSEAQSLYNYTGITQNHNIRERRGVMESIINGSWGINGSWRRWSP